MKRPIESDYTSHVTYTRALEEYSLNQDEALRMALEFFESFVVGAMSRNNAEQLAAESITKIKEVLHD